MFVMDTPKIWILPAVMHLDEASHLIFNSQFPSLTFAILKFKKPLYKPHLVFFKTLLNKNGNYTGIPQKV